MKNSPFSRGVHRLSLSIRHALALALCAALLTSTTAPALAQKRTAIRVSPGGEASSTTLPRNKERARAKTRGGEREREGYSRGRLKATQDAYSVSQTQDTLGVPWSGEVGVTRTTDDLMRDQLKAAPTRNMRPLMEEHEIPGRKERPQDPDAQPIASTPIDFGANARKGTLSKGKKAGSVVQPRAPQTLGLNFDTVTGPTETGAFPPDTMGAVGPTQFFVFLNGRLRTFNKTTGVADGVVNVDSDVFFSSVMTPPAAGEVVFTTDPQVRYDRLSGRWILIMVDVVLNGTTGATTKSNRLLIAVSDAGSSNAITASTVWTLYFVQQDTVGGIASTNQFLDYPSLGVDANALYIGGDMFTLAGAFQNTSAFVIRKSSVLSGGPVVTTAFRNLIGTDGMLEPRGVDNYNPSATEGYFIGASFAAFSRLCMRRVSDPGGTPTISANIAMTTPGTTTSAISVDHLGNTGGTNGRLDGLDDRLYAAHIRNGRLWTAHSFTTDNTGVASTNATNRRMSVRWYEIIVPPGTGTPTFNQTGTIFDSANTTQANARQYWLPSVMVSGQGHAALGYSTAGTPFRANAATNGRLASDTLGTTGAVNIYTSTSSAYNPPGDPGPPRRWGDYSFTSLDPLDDMTMWTIQEYCNGTNTYGTRVVKLNAPPPATPTAAVPPTVPAGSSSTNVVINGTSVSGSGFYDPGANLASPALPFNHINATVTGGVTVNSVTYNSPTQVTLNISTVGATVGPKDVTITNPDGQSMTGTAVITVTPAPAPPAASGQVVISELRFHGLAGATDEFVELYNATNAALDISGFTLQALNAAGTPTTVFTAPGALGSSTTVIPARGHYLVTGAAYGLGALTASNGSLTADIPDGSGVGLFAGAVASGANRIDSAGFDNRDPLFFEGTPISPSGAGTGGITVNGEYSFVRQLGSGTPQDSGNNDTDFLFVSVTHGVFSTRASTLGAPGPENLASPIQRNSTIKASLIDPTAASNAPPNRIRSAAGANPVNAAFGTLDIRRKFTNTTGASISALRFRLVDVTTRTGTTAPPAGTADLRLITSTDTTANGGLITIIGTTLDAPTQVNGGGLNSSVTVALPGGSLANGSSINVRFLLGVMQDGAFRFLVNVEAVP
ncbi:MAG TPA: lamin tail domain-containing protein [Pyrinomonadaceae bacterium]|nr:lamin tail domain-containing protein [Pyrinomonadaceae bacterium]